MTLNATFEEKHNEGMHIAQGASPFNIIQR